MIQSTIVTSFLFLLFLLINLSAPVSAKDSAAAYVAATGDALSTSAAYSKHRPATLMSSDGKYRVSLYSSEAPIPLQQIHSWYVHVESADGKPVEEARIYVHGGMPMHRHGFPTKPRVKDYLGNGDYRIDGVKFSMPGHWEMRLNIKEKTRRDRVVFGIDL